jgi:hypothetical protein
MSRKRDDLAGAEAILAVSSRLLTHWERLSDAICALPADAADSCNVPNLMPMSRHRTSISCKDTRYGNNVRTPTDHELNAYIYVYYIATFWRLCLMNMMHMQSTRMYTTRTS